MFNRIYGPEFYQTQVWSLATLVSDWQTNSLTHSFTHSLGWLRFWSGGLEEILNLDFGHDSEAEVWPRFWIIFGQNFEPGVWSRFWSWILSNMTQKQLPWWMQATLGSVLPWAMFLQESYSPQPHRWHEQLCKRKMARRGIVRWKSLGGVIRPRAQRQGVATASRHNCIKPFWQRADNNWNSFQPLLLICKESHGGFKGSLISSHLLPMKIKCWARRITAE